MANRGQEQALEKQNNELLAVAHAQTISILGKFLSSDTKCASAWCVNTIDFGKSDHIAI